MLGFCSFWLGGLRFAIVGDWGVGPEIKQTMGCKKKQGFFGGVWHGVKGTLEKVTKGQERGKYQHDVEQLLNIHPID